MVSEHQSIDDILYVLDLSIYEKNWNDVTLLLDHLLYFKQNIMDIFKTSVVNNYFNNVDFLLNNGFCNEEKNFALWKAVELRNYKVVKTLIKHKADVNSYSCGPLKTAIINSDFNMVKLLTMHGAKCSFDYKKLIGDQLEKNDYKIIEFLKNK